DQRRLVADRGVELQDADRRPAFLALLLSLRRGRREWRPLGRADQDVRCRKAVQDCRRQRLHRPRFPTGGFPGVRYGRAGELDGPADRCARRKRDRRPTGCGLSMRRSRKVKILATLGPASSEQAMIHKLLDAGADAFRINMSHADHALMRMLVERIRAVEKETGRPIGVLADLQGPKLRVGTFKEKMVPLQVGQTFVLDDNPTPGDTKRVHLPHPEIIKSVEPGHRILIDDGRVQLRAEKVDADAITATVLAGTKISDRKGVSLPDTDLPVGALTEKDRRDLE